MSPQDEELMAIRLTLAELVGVSGRNGRLSEMQSDIDENRDAIIDQRKLILKVLLASLAGVLGVTINLIMQMIK